MNHEICDVVLREGDRFVKAENVRSKLVKKNKPDGSSLNGEKPRRLALKPRAAHVDAVLSKLIDVCNARGVRVTSLRSLLLREMVSNPGHPSVDDLLRAIKPYRPRLSFASIYRAIRSLEDAKLILRHHFQDVAARFELLEPDTEAEHHDHLVDVRTGEIIEFQHPMIEHLQKEVSEKMGYRLVGHRLYLYGERIKK